MYGFDSSPASRLASGAFQGGQNTEPAAASNWQHPATAYPQVIMGIFELFPPDIFGHPRGQLQIVIP